MEVDNPRKLLAALYGTEAINIPEIKRNIEQYGSYRGLLERIRKLEDENARLRKDETSALETRMEGEEQISPEVMALVEQMTGRMEGVERRLGAEHRELLAALQHKEAGEASELSDFVRTLPADGKTVMEDGIEKFFLGMHSKVVAEGAGAKNGGEDVEFIVLRSRIALNQIDFVIKATKAGESQMHKGVGLLAAISRINDEKRAEQEFEAKVSELEGAIATSPYVAICVAILYLKFNRPGDALGVLNGLQHIEAPMLRVQALLQLNRVDLAEREAERVSNPVLSALAKAWVALNTDREAAKSALFALQDVLERFEPTPILLNTIACCHFMLGEWENAKMALQDAIERFPNDESIQINNAIALNHSSEFQQFQTQASLIMSMKNQYTKRIETLLEDFDSTAARLDAE